MPTDKPQIKPTTSGENEEPINNEPLNERINIEDGQVQMPPLEDVEGQKADEQPPERKKVRKFLSPKCLSH